MCLRYCSSRWGMSLLVDRQTQRQITSEHSSRYRREHMRVRTSRGRRRSEGDEETSSPPPRSVAFEDMAAIESRAGRDSRIRRAGGKEREKEGRDRSRTKETEGRERERE